MPNSIERARIAPDECCREASEILARGILRLHQRAAIPREKVEENLPKLLAAGLEVPDETVLSVHTG